jgi:DNA polymerase
VADLDPNARARRLARQHAETARLLGVDFVPMYRAAGSGEAMAAPQVVAQPVVQPVAQSVTQSVVAPPPRRVAVVEVAPPASAPTLPANGAAVGAAATAAVGTATSATASATTSGTTSAPRDRAASQARLDALRARYEADAPHAKFVTAHTNIVWGDGDPCARLVFVGEAPGEEEDKTGVPFVGRAGQLLNKMIVAMGIARSDVYICNVLKTRPPNNATPTAFEAAACKPYLMEQLAIVRPEVIVTLGLPASHTLLNTTESMARLRGKWASLTLPDGVVVPVVPTYHPAYVLRQYTEETRRKVWSDLLLVAERLGLPVASQPRAREE